MGTWQPAFRLRRARSRLIGASAVLMAGSPGFRTVDMVTSMEVRDAAEDGTLLLGDGIEVLRAGTGGNPHTLVADPGTCRWTTGVHDPEGLALGALVATGIAYLIHPEHGGSGIAPGTYVIRRQRESGGTTHRSSPFPHAANPAQFVID